MQLSTREAERIFNKLEVEPVKSSHHVRGFVCFNGTRLLPIHYSNGRKDMPGHVPKRFAKSLHISISEFAELKRCTLSRAAYFEILRNQGFLDQLQTGTENDRAA